MEIQTELSLEMIETLNMSEARRLCRAKSAPNYKEAKDLDGFKQCLRIYFYKENYRNQHERREAAEVFQSLAKTYGQSCKKLKSMLKSIKDLMLEVQMSKDPLFDQMEKIVPNFMTSIDYHIEKLEKSNFRILIAGELSAGKTMLLNSLLGKVVLPSNFQSNTATICEITKSPDEKQYAEVFPWPGEGEKKTVLDGPSFLDKIANYIEEKADDNNSGRYAKVIIYLNIDFLEEGITIVDSPGIGDKSGLTNMVIDELVNASAFLYVINVSNRLGVQEDRLVNLLQKVVELKSLDDQRMFSPESAVFVCNQWDTVKLHDRKNVLAKIKEKLTKEWGDLKDEQIIPFSALEAEMAEKAYPEESSGGCMTPEFINLLDGIKRLIPHGLENKLTFSYCWIQSFVKRLSRQITGHQNKCYKSATENQKSLDSALAEIKKLSEYSKKKIVKLREYVENEIKAISKDLKKYLKQDETFNSFCNLQEGTQFNNPEMFKKVVKETFGQILKSAIYTWEADHKRFANVCPEVVRRYNNMYEEILQKLDKASSIIDSHPVDMTIDPLKSDQQDTKRISQIISNKLEMSVETTSRKVAVGLTAPLWIPAVLVLGFPGIMYYGFLYLVEHIKEMNMDILMKRYDENPDQVLGKMMRLNLDNFCKNALEAYVRRILQPAFNMVVDLEKVIPEQIDADKKQIELLKGDDRNEKDLALYPQLHDKVNSIKNRLHHFELFNLMSASIPTRKKFFSTDVKIQEKVVSNLIADIHDGSVHGINESVSIRSYKKPITTEDMMSYLDEETTYMHGCQSNLRLVRFYGIVQIKEDSMHFILEHISKPLRAYNMVSLIPKTSDVTLKISLINPIMKAILEGLSYLHDKKMTHFDLSLDTVAMVDNKKIKLVNFTKNRKLPADIAHVDPEPYRYISPDALRGLDYGSASDMYAIGLMMWELWTGCKAYEMELKGMKSVRELLNYVENSRPDLCCESLKRNELAVRNWKKLMLDSWKLKQCERIKARDWLKQFNESFVKID